MVWKNVETLSQLSEIFQSSFLKPQLVFKHSTRCGISVHVLHLLDSMSAALLEKTEIHYLDLLEHREISNRIATEWGIPHQSPQAILINEGKVVYHASHYAIKPEIILSKIKPIS